ncbi:MAG: glycosyltransferase family 2 protein, partial [Candidatus Odinarchaeota archaeon]
IELPMNRWNSIRRMMSPPKIPPIMANLPSTISIVIPSYNGAPCLKKNLESIKSLNNLNEIELVIVDNLSTDSTLSIIKSYENDINIKLIKNDFNEGFAGACNSGVINSEGEFVFITNQDVLFPSDFFTKLMSIYYKVKKSSEIVISPALIFETGRIHYFGAKNHFLGFSYTPEVGEPLPKNVIIKRTQRFSGGTLFIKKDFFLKMGGFYKQFFMYYEDTDLSLKMLRNGVKIYTTNDPFLIHQKKFQTLNDLQYYFLERNRFIVLIRNIENIYKLIPFMIIVEVILLFHAFFINKFKLRLKVYQDLIFNHKQLQILREESKKEGLLLSYKKLSKDLDPILLGKMKKFNVFRILLTLLNKILNLA